MTRETINNGHLGSIYEQFAYLPDLVLYQDSSYMNELSEMPDAPRLGVRGKNNGIRVSELK